MTTDIRSGASPVANDFTGDEWWVIETMSLPYELRPTLVARGNQRRQFANFVKLHHQLAIALDELLSGTTGHVKTLDGALSFVDDTELQDIPTRRPSGRHVGYSAQARLKRGPGKLGRLSRWTATSPFVRFPVLLSCDTQVGRYACRYWLCQRGLGALDSSHQDGRNASQFAKRWLSQATKHTPVRRKSFVFWNPNKLTYRFSKSFGYDGKHVDLRRPSARFPLIDGGSRYSCHTSQIGRAPAGAVVHFRPHTFEPFGLEPTQNPTAHTFSHAFITRHCSRPPLQSLSVSSCRLIIATNIVVGRYPRTDM